MSRYYISKKIYDYRIRTENTLPYAIDELTGYNEPDEETVYILEEVSDDNVTTPLYIMVENTLYKLVKEAFHD